MFLQKHKFLRKRVVFNSATTNNTLDHVNPENPSSGNPFLQDPLILFALPLRYRQKRKKLDQHSVAWSLLVVV